LQTKRKTSLQQWTFPQVLAIEYQICELEELYKFEEQLKIVSPLINLHQARYASLPHFPIAAMYKKNPSPLAFF
jgi:hypothetical protein